MAQLGLVLGELKLGQKNSVLKKCYTGFLTVINLTWQKNAFRQLGHSSDERETVVLQSPIGAPLSVILTSFFTSLQLCQPTKCYKMKLKTEHQLMYDFDQIHSSMNYVYLSTKTASPIWLFSMSDPGPWTTYSSYEHQSQQSSYQTNPQLPVYRLFRVWIWSIW